MKLRWEEPPPDGRGAQGEVHPRAIAAELVAHPGRWALIRQYDNPASAGAHAYRIRNGVVKVFAPSGAFEAVMRTADGGAAVYARYVGEAGEHR